MTSITNFNFRGATVRTVVLPNGEPGFVGKDVAERLGYANHNDAIGRHCKGVVIRYPLQTAGGRQEVRILTEPDVLRLIVSSTPAGCAGVRAVGIRGGAAVDPPHGQLRDEARTRRHAAVC